MLEYFVTMLIIGIVCFSFGVVVGHCLDISLNK